MSRVEVSDGSDPWPWRRNDLIRGRGVVVKVCRTGEWCRIGLCRHPTPGVMTVQNAPSVRKLSDVLIVALE